MNWALRFYPASTGGGKHPCPRAAGDARLVALGRISRAHHPPMREAADALLPLSCAPFARRARRDVASFAACLALFLLAHSASAADEAPDSAWPRQFDSASGSFVVYQPQPEEMHGDVLLGRVAFSVQRTTGAVRRSVCCGSRSASRSIATAAR